MRSAPLALFFGSRARVSKDIVERATRITHTHPEAIELTYAYVCILAGLLEGLSVPDALKYTQELSWHSEGLKHLLAHPTEEPRDPEAWPGRGAGLLTLHVALWTLTTTDTFIQGIRQSIVIGGDTDTYAAVAGSFLGALYGEDSIPRTWKDTLLGADVMIDIAERLYVHAHS
jgi:ADP-ribosylglycohydrolase